MNINSNKSIDMRNGAVLPAVIRFSLPIMAGNVLQLMFGAADMIVAGRFAGSGALAAVGANTSLINLIVNLFIGLSLGTNIVTARFYGAESVRDVQETVRTAVAMSLICGGGLGVFGAAAAPVLLRGLGTPGDILGSAVCYLRIYSVGMPLVMLYNFGSAAVTAAGDTKRPLYCLMTAGAANVTLNVFFVAGMGWGVAGVAAATVLSNGISAGMILRCLCRGGGAVDLKLRELRLYGDKVGEILRVGVPAGLQGVGFSISSVIIQAAVNSFGAAAVAGNTATISIEGFLYTAMYGFYQSCSTFTAQNAGAGRFDRVGRVLYVCLGCAFAAGTLAAILCLGFDELLAGMYCSDPSATAVAVTRMWIVFPLYALCGMNDVMAGSMRGMGHSAAPLVVSTLGACVFRILWIATVFRWLGSLESLYVSYPVSWVLTFAAHFLCFQAIRRRTGNVDRRLCLPVKERGN